MAFILADAIVPCKDPGRPADAGARSRIRSGLTPYTGSRVDAMLIALGPWSNRG